MSTWTMGSWTHCRERNCIMNAFTTKFFLANCAHSLLGTQDRGLLQEKILTLSRHAIEASKPFQVDLKRVLPDGSKIRFLASFRYAGLCATKYATLHAFEEEKQADSTSSIILFNILCS